MVATRRARASSEDPSDSELQATPSKSAATATPSKTKQSTPGGNSNTPTSSRGKRGGARAKAANVLETLAEEEPGPAAAAKEDAPNAASPAHPKKGLSKAAPATASPAVTPAKQATPASKGKAVGSRGGAAVAAAAPQQDQPSISDDDEEDEEEVERVAFDDDDEFLGGCSMEQLAASIRHALQGKHFNLGGAGGSSAAAAAREGEQQEEDEQPGAGAEEEDEEEEEGDEEGGSAASKKRKLEEKKRQQEGPNLLRWQPRVELPKQPASSSRLVHQREPEKGAGKEKGLAAQLLAPARDPARLAKQAKKAAPETAGRSWYDMPATRIDEHMKQELRLLRLRGAFDPKRFYKGFDRTKFPKFFQMGKVVDAATDFYGGRLTNAERKSTLTEQLMADAELSQVRKKRFSKLQAEASKYAPLKKKQKRAGDKPRATKNVKHVSR